MRLLRHKKEWWINPKLPPNKLRRVPARLMYEDPTSSKYELPERRTGKVGSFAPSRKWKRYSYLENIDAGYITPLYDMKAISYRYGLTQNSSRYFKRHLLPEPFDVVRRRSVASHHWSRFTLMVLDVVLADLEKLGYHQFLKSFDDHLDNLHDGVSYLEAHYGDRYEYETPKTGDKYGVSWE